MRVAVCELAHDATVDMVERCLAEAKADLLVLNELPFGQWLAGARRFDDAAAAEQVALYNLRLSALATQPDLPPVLTTRCRLSCGRLVNEAVLIIDGAIKPVHQKIYFPQEPGFFEQSWFHAVVSSWEPVSICGLRVGVLICTELMFTEYARAYAAAGCDLIAVPRCSDGSDTWLTAGRMAALASGCYIVSSNRSGSTPDGQSFGGGGFVIAPGGEVLNLTNSSASVVVEEVRPEKVRAAQAGYPCYLTLKQFDLFQSLPNII